MFYAINLRKLLKKLLPLAIVAALIVMAVVFVRVAYPVRHLDLVRRFSEQHGLDPALVLAVINAESRFRTDAQSHAGAKGLMQLMDTTAAWAAQEAGLHGYAERVFEPEANIALGSWYLARLLRQFNNEQTALAAYNAGSGRVSGWLNNPEYSTDGITLHNIPFPETRRYVQRVAHFKRVYQLLLRIPFL